MGNVGCVLLSNVVKCSYREVCELPTAPSLVTNPNSQSVADVLQKGNITVNVKSSLFK